MEKNSFLSYLQYEKRYSKLTLKAYESDLNQFGLFLSNTFQIQKISLATQKQIRFWMVDLMNKDISAKSIARKLSSLKSFYKFLQRRNLREDNPAFELDPPKLGQRLPRVHESETIEKLLNEFHFGADFTGLRDKLMVEVLFGTGLRLAELINLKIEDINLIGQSMKIIGKGNKERWIPLNQNLIAAYMKYLPLRTKRLVESEGKELTFVFLTDKGQKAYPKLIHRRLARLLNYVTTSTNQNPHSVRHTFATTLINNGADLNAIKELLGHSSLAATQHYTHSSIEQLKNVYRKAHPKSVDPA